MIPSDIRERLGLKPGDMLRYRVIESGVLIEKAPLVPADDPFAEFDEWAGSADEKAFATF